MIKVRKEANKITIKGHADYNDGPDIVCASVSSIMITTVNAILRFGDDLIEYKDDGNTVTIEILNNTDIVKSLIINMMSLLMELASKYPKNIKIESEE